MDYKREISKKISAITGIDAEEIFKAIEVPPKENMGDYAFPCFFLAKEMRKSPASIAAELAEKLDDEVEFLDRINVQGGYLNFFIKASVFIKDIVAETLERKDLTGSSDEGKGKTVLVEFSSPNIAKPFHVGHAFTTVLGNSLHKIYKHLGYNTVRLNHLGDYGTQFGKLISAYERWGDEKSLEIKPIDELLRIYVKFHDEAKKNPELEEEARLHFRNLENNAEYELSLWKKFRDLSLKEFDKIYERLGVGFDDLNGESFYSDKIQDVVSILNEKNLLVESEGAKVVMLDDFGLPPCIILKSDGTTIYASRDIAAVLYRARKYDFHKNIYVVGNPQALHFRQVFAVAEKMDIKHSKSCIHVGFGLVKFSDMKFSTREGNIILLDDLLNECVAKTYSIIRENNSLRNTEMSEKEMKDTAEKIGIGAVIYTFCKNSRDRDIVFSWDDMLSFEGDSAPYVMYTYARCRSILRKAEYREDENIEADFSGADSAEEFQLLKLIYGLKDSIKNSADVNEPYILVRQINSIARSFNRFYNNVPILSGTDENIKRERLMICHSASIAMKTGLNLLGIETVERM